MKHDERRSEMRIPVTRPVKMRCMHTGKFMVGQTMNLSPGGMLVEVERPSLLVAGQRLEMGISFEAPHGLIRSSDLLGGTVTRSAADGGSQRVAVQFDHRQSLPLAMSA